MLYHSIQWFKDFVDRWRYIKLVRCFHLSTLIYQESWCHNKSSKCHGTLIFIFRSMRNFIFGLGWKLILSIPPIFGNSFLSLKISKHDPHLIPTLNKTIIDYTLISYILSFDIQHIKCTQDSKYEKLLYRLYIYFTCKLASLFIIYIYYS